MHVVRARWSSASFLLYAGGIVVLLATAALLGALAGDYGDAAFFGWTLLVLVALGDLAFGARAVGRPLSAGLFALSSVVALAVSVGALVQWLGWLADSDSPFGGFHVSHFAIELTLIVGAAFALRTFRFPLLVFLLAGASWFFVTDALSNGGGWSAAVSLVFGLLLMVVALRADDVHAFWLHVVAGLTVGGALLFFAHSSDADWLLIAFASLVLVSFAATLQRSSYAVLAAIGLFLVTTHFADSWFGAPPTPYSFLSVAESPGHPWASALLYAGYGLVLMGLGLWLAYRRGRTEPD